MPVSVAFVAFITSEQDSSWQLSFGAAVLFVSEVAFVKKLIKLQERFMSVGYSAFVAALEAVSPTSPYLLEVASCQTFEHQVLKDGVLLRPIKPKKELQVLGHSLFFGCDC